LWNSSRIRQLFPNAKIFFATSTPVIEEQATWGYRSNTEICQYNEIAKSVLKSFDVPINDLYTFSTQYCQALHRDWVHYNDEGSDLLAKQVIDFLQPYL
jgi:lysophospholipase L1-like esterase